MNKTESRPQPMSDEQITALYRNWWDTHGTSYADLVRAVESARDTMWQVALAQAEPAAAGEPMRRALTLARAVLRQTGGLDMLIAANGSTIGAVIERALSCAVPPSPAAQQAATAAPDAQAHCSRHDHRSHAGW